MKKLVFLISGIFSFIMTAFAQTVSVSPAANNEIAMRNGQIEAFKLSLINKPLPPFHFTDINKNAFDLKELKGRILLINFWFTACKPCISEMPFLNELVEANRDKPVAFIAPAPEKEKVIKHFLKRFTFKYNIIPASTDYITQLNVENFPTHLVVDKEGIVREVLIGYADDIKDKLQTQIDKLLKN